MLRLEVMENTRKACDKAEATVPADLWTLGTYQELLFLDANQVPRLSSLGVGLGNLPS